MPDSAELFPDRTSKPAPFFLKPLVPASGAEMVALRFETVTRGWSTPLSKLSGPVPSKVQSWLAVVRSCAVKVPMVNGASRVTVRLAVMLMVLKLAVAVAPEAMVSPIQLPGVFQLPLLFTDQVPLVCAWDNWLSSGMNAKTMNGAKALPGFFDFMIRLGLPTTIGNQTNQAPVAADG